MADKVDRVHVRFADVLSSPQAKSPCAFCAKETAKYTCPRCNIRYCSSACYKTEKHMQCSELFYKECVIEAMNEQKGSEESKRRMLEMLTKLEEQDRQVQNDLETEDLEERLGEIDINNADPEAVWSALTDRERKDFESAVESGEISNAIDIWVPWWSSRDDGESRNKIEDVTEESSSTEETHKKPEAVKENRCYNIPHVKKKIPSLSSVMKNSSPNPNVQFSCIDVLFSYVYVMRQWVPRGLFRANSR